MTTLTGTRASSSRPRVRARAFERMHSRGNAIRIFGDARERDAGDAETRERARGICGIFLGRVRSRGRRPVVARTTTARRPDDDGPSTERRRLVDRVKRRGCRSETICSYDLSLGCGGSRERERRDDE